MVVTTWGKNFDAIQSSALQLDIADRVIFAPVAGKRLLVKYLRSADCLLDQFALGYYGATGIEGAACGVPVIMRFEHAQYDALFESGAPPFLNASTSTEVSNALEFLATDAERRRELSKKHREWFLISHSGQRWADDYFAILGALALGHKFSFAGSPLAAETSAAERLYHAEQLAAAPEFPNYEKPRASTSEMQLSEHVREQSHRISELTAEVNARLDRIEPQMSKMFGLMQKFDERYSKLWDTIAVLVGPLLKVVRWIHQNSVAAAQLAGRLRNDKKKDFGH